MSDESIKHPSRSTNIPNPLWYYVGTKTRVKLKGCCLIQDKISFIHGKIVNSYLINIVCLWDKQKF